MMENIIRKAIEGGYTPESTPDNDNYTLSYRIEYGGITITQHNKISSEELLFVSKERIILDPLFWQALGKKCEWIEKGEWLMDSSFNEYQALKNQWLEHALHFHEINLTEGWDAAVSYLAQVTNINKPE